MTDFNGTTSQLIGYSDSMESSSSWTPPVRSVPRIQAAKRRYRIGANASASEQLVPVELPNDADVAILNGTQAQVVEIQTERAKRRVIALLGMFHEHGYSAVADRDVRISKQTWEVATQLIRMLPSEAPLPKVLPDGEDGVIFAWLFDNKKFFVTIDNYTLHGVDNAGTPDAVYFDGVKFRGDQIPSAFITALTAV
jgi:hypothetical protein